MTLRRPLLLACLAVLTTCALGGTLESKTVAASSEQNQSLRISPNPVLLNSANRRQQILITFVKGDREIDVTREATIALSSHDSATLVGSVVSANRDGREELSIRYGDEFLQIPVLIENVSSIHSVHFVNDVVPLFSKLGCNSGGCHGKASGQNGFKLSVFGFDPQADFSALSRESRGRRVFTGDPENSLLILKAIGLSAHGGGRRCKPDSPDHKLLSDWIRQGMPWGDDSAPTVTSVRVEPSDRVLGRSADQQLLVTAVYSDGSTRDVTDAAAYSTNSPVVADVDPGGLVHTGTVPGPAAITVNYMGRVAVARILVPQLVPDGSFPELPANPIDHTVWRELQRLGILPSELCDDSTFLRRTSLRVLGRLPTPEEVRTFLGDATSEKRSRTIDAFLEREEFADFQALQWADILLVDRVSLGERGAYEFHQWLRNQIAVNRPYDEWVRELLTATGVSGKYGPVNFYRAMRTPDELTRGVSQAFLGIRMDCAQCHHHPFEKWGQEDFYGMSGFFNGLQQKKLSDTRELVFHAGYRPTKMPQTDIVVVTRPPGGEPIDTTAADPRVQLAEWMTAPENPMFARLVANRLWKQFLGRGLVDPVDDLRSTNPASNEPLLNYLTQQVIEHSFNLKAVMRLILNSQAYQLSSKSNESNLRDEQNFSHYLEERLPAEVLLDAICDVTGVVENFPGMPVGTRAIQVWDNRFPSYFLDTFGRSARQSPCECGKSGAPTMSQALHLMNAPEISARLSSKQGRLTMLNASEMSPDEILNELALAAWGRLPNDRERKAAARIFSQSDRRQACEDLMWAMLNSYDFLFVR
ncbi:MAG: DUF1553 domain-containing protein [Planctomycetota bacterium]|nr:DUF1553 domain-containing protein [Planctomycetota bacterium]MDA1163427.1 DUF1553 domain-containing protein [Planctomycetota bacterium]